MHLTASDFISYYRPSPCELRVLLRHRGEPEAKPGPFDEVLRRLGQRHETQHLQTLGPYVDLSSRPFEERLAMTREEVAQRSPVLYQPAFMIKTALAGVEVNLSGIPDFLILDGDGYLIRDSKMARHIDEDHHPEILLQVRLYAWLFEKSFGCAPKALQVHNGMNDIVPVAQDGGSSALGRLERLMSVTLSEREPYEPVGWTKCGGCGFNERCWAWAESHSDVALVPDVDQGLARTLHKMGVSSRGDLVAKFDINSLAELKRPFGTGERRVGKTALRIFQSVEAMEANTEKVLAVPAIPKSANCVMFDLEGMPPHLDEIEKIYLWGVQVFGDRPSDFMAAVSGFGQDGDRQGWLAFLSNASRIFDSYGDVPFVHWAPYERTKLGLYVDRYGDVDGLAVRVRNNLVDLLPIVRNSIVLPLPSLSLKVVEKYVGFRRQLPDTGGEWAMATFIEATETDDAERRDSLMKEILRYNQEDLEATWAVLRWVQAKK